MLANLVFFSLTLLLLISLAKAELFQGPTGVEYAKRFEPSACGQGVSSFYECPTYAVSDNVLPTEPTSYSGDTSVTGQTTCSYPVDGSPPTSATCTYQNSDGALIVDVSDESCTTQATTRTCRGGRRKRNLSRLEAKILERQWKGPGKY